MATTLLQGTELSGVWQMALDAALLEQRRPILRFYRWSRPTLSLGFHQQPLQPAWLQWQRTGGGDLVRRPSGGGAVLHGGDLCYALVWPDPACGRLEAYRQVCAWMQRAFAELGEPLVFGGAAASTSGDCFARSTSADLLTAEGQKRIGSAQRWQRGCLLQHGSIQLNPDRVAWQQLLNGPGPQLPDLGLSPAQLAEHLLSAAPPWLQLTATEHPLDAELLALAGNQLERYRLGG